MARTPSTMLALGTAAPAFNLPEPASGKKISLAEFANQPLVVLFICNHCPYVKHIAAKLAELARHYQPQGVAFVAINSNDIAHYPDDSPAKMVEMVAEYAFTFPYLFDETQAVARSYRAACTPDLYLFDAAHTLVYRGQFDDARPRSEAPVTGKDLAAALDALLAGKAINAEQKASLGCNIKWRPGNEPDYYG